MGCYYTLCHNTYAYSLLFYKVYIKRENAGSWNSGLEKEQILETYSAQLQKSWNSTKVIFGNNKKILSGRNTVGWLVRHMPRDGLSLWEPIKRRRCLETGWGEDMHAGESYPGSGLSVEITPLVLLCGVSAWSLDQGKVATIAPRAVGFKGEEEQG